MSAQGCRVDECDHPYKSKGYCKMHAERVRRNGHPNLTGRRRKTMDERLWPKVDRTGGPDACWPFLPPVNREGYGFVRTGGLNEPTIGAHRAAWMLSNPDAERPEHIDHLCHDPQTCKGGTSCPHRKCCNPAHLTAATAAENNSPERRRNPYADGCLAGHPWTEANTRVRQYPDGRTSRIFRACDLRRFYEGKAAS